MWHLFSDRTGHSVPLGRHLYKCYSGCAFQFLQVLHCTVVTHWAKTRVSKSADWLLLSLRGKEKAVLSLSTQE